VLPMVLGLGCDTMATMTTRILGTPKERLIAITLLALGVPCSAQLATIMGILGGISVWALLLLFAVVLGQMVLVGFLAAQVLPGDRSDFILELPPLRLPRIKNLLTKTLLRVRWYLGQDESARQTLEDALRRGGPPPLPYLGQLFLGQALERVGRATEAARAYEEALALEPQSQAAALALSHLRLSSGNAAGARRVLEQALAHAGRRAESDPYWIYPASNALATDDTLEALRREASP